MHASNQVTVTVSTLAAPVGKNGKVSTNNAKALALLNGADRAIVVSAALTSKGAVRAVARSAMLASVATLDSMLSRETLDGSDWGNLLALLVGEFGASVYSRATMSGKNGCTVYLKNVIGNAQVAFTRAETAKAQVKPMATISSAEQALANVARLTLASEQARMMAAQAAEQAAQAAEQVAEQVAEFEQVL